MSRLCVQGTDSAGKGGAAVLNAGILTNDRFSPQSLCSSPSPCQDSIESRLEKRTKGVFGAVGGKRLVAFIDDLNMPAKSKFGFMPPLELLKLWADNGFWWATLAG